MADRSINVRLHDIEGEIDGILQLTEGCDDQEFAASWGMKRAVQHALLIIAEAAKHIPPELKAQRPEVPWQKIHGLGNLLRHEYRRVDPLILWSVVTDHLAPLREAVSFMFRVLDREAQQRERGP